jgi:hypothetical protein
MDHFKTFAGPLPPYHRMGEPLPVYTPPADPWRAGEQAEAAKAAIPHHLPDVRHNPWLDAVHPHLPANQPTGAEQNVHAMLEAHHLPQTMGDPSLRTLGRRAMGNRRPGLYEVAGALARQARYDPAARQALTALRSSHRPMHRR